VTWTPRSTSPPESRRYIASVRDRSLDVLERPPFASSRLEERGAYLGPPVRLSALLLDPPHSLLRQSWEPRRQRYGRMNADGFGVGWYPGGDDTDGGPQRDGPENSAAPLAGQLPAADLVTLDAATDSALLWALTRARLEKDPSLSAALAAVVELAAPAGGRRLKLPPHRRCRRRSYRMGGHVVLPHRPCRRRGGVRAARRRLGLDRGARPVTAPRHRRGRDLDSLVILDPLVMLKPVAAAAMTEASDSL
jgi:hypothetical protein